MMANTTGERSAGDIVQDVLRDVGEIVQGEIRLAKAELREQAGRAGQAGGLAGGAAVCGLLAGGCFAATCIAAMALAMPVWLASLLMCIFLVCAGAACYAGARARFKQIDPVPERAVRTAKETVEWAKNRTK
jgi:protein-S-isoprenylcysteine O-methyltransferase Ste14